LGPASDRGCGALDQQCRSWKSAEWSARAWPSQGRAGIVDSSTVRPHRRKIEAEVSGVEMGFSIKDTRLVAGGGDKVCADKSVTMGRNGSFDARLIKRKAGRWDLEIFMKLQFFFYDGEEKDFAKASDAAWTQKEREAFMTGWHKVVRNFWTTQNAGALSDKKTIGICFNFEIQEAGWMWDNFEIDVTKAPPGKFLQSYVLQAVFDGDVKLDSNDLVPKASGQLAAVHEFGHMFGLPDEYTKSSTHKSDSGSIMHGGTTVRLRHFKDLISWAEKNKC
jgi:hypothetical protein